MDDDLITARLEELQRSLNGTVYFNVTIERVDVKERDSRRDRECGLQTTLLEYVKCVS
jgi:hypothetical protein